MRLYVGNVPFQETSEGLAGFVEAAGFRVAEAKIIEDSETGRSKGFGFVELVEGEDAGRVIRKLHGQRFGGRPLRVAPAKPLDREARD